MAKDSFYSTLGEWNDKLVTGASIKFGRSVEYDKFSIDIPEIAELVSLSVPELEKRRESSAKLEQDIYGRIQDTLKEWDAQAAQTLLLDKALEYAHTPQVVHTDNKWEQMKDGHWEISNLVYKMGYQIWEDAAGGKKGTWLVTWALGINRPKRPPTERFNLNGDYIIAEQKKKRYDSFDTAQRYIQGRFDLYAHNFSELRPPVPEKYKRHFYINGCLLPGYTIAPPERTEPDMETVNTLLDFLDKGDGSDPLPIPAVEDAPAPQSEPAPPPSSAAKAEAAPEKKPVPAPKKKPPRPVPKPGRKKSQSAPAR